MGDDRKVFGGREVRDEQDNSDILFPAGGGMWPPPGGLG